MLALDPAFRNVGWTVWDKGKICACGVEQTTRVKKGVSKHNAAEAERLAKAIRSLISKYKVGSVVAEIPTGSRDSRSANLGGIIMGVVASVCGVLAIPLTWVAPNDIKRVVASKGVVSKDMIMGWVREKYPFPGYPKAKVRFEHIADSVLVYVFCEKGIDKI